MPLTTLFWLIQVYILLGTLLFWQLKIAILADLWLIGIMFTVSTPGFLGFWDFWTLFCLLEKAWFWMVRVGFGGREGALASALIILLSAYQNINRSVIYIALVLLWMVCITTQCTRQQAKCEKLVKKCDRRINKNSCQIPGTYRNLHFWSILNKNLYF